MNIKSTIESRSPILTFSAAALASIAALTILWAVVALFQSRGAPMEQLLAAERACVHHAYQSEREVCMKQWLAESQAASVAAR